MALPWWIESARNALAVANNSYAEIQKQLDRYNKVFDVFSKASPETQIRAASVMRQALNEYNWLKKQQEKNALRIYEAQNWVDYYNRNPHAVPTAEVSPTSGPISQQQVVPINNYQPIQAVPWTSNNNVPVEESNAIDTNFTMNATVPDTVINQTYNSPYVPAWVRNYIDAMTPKYPNTSLSPVTRKTTSPYTVKWTNYWPGTVATIPSPNVTTTTPWTTSVWKRWNPGTRRQFNLNR